MANSELTNVPKLNIFQRIRKFFLKRNITGEKYQRADEILKNQPDVIESLMARSVYNLRFLSHGHALDYLREHPDAITTCENKSRMAFLEDMPELFTSLNESQQYQVLFFDKKNQFFKSLPKEKQLQLLTENNEFYMSVDKNYGYVGTSGLYFENSSSAPMHGYVSGKLKLEPSYFYDKLKYFDEDVLIEVISKYSQDFDETKKYGDKTRQAYYEAERFFRDIKIDELPRDLKLKLALIDNRLLSKMDVETVATFVDNNPLLLKKLPNNVLQAVIKENPMLVNMLSYNQRNDFSFIPGVKENIFLNKRFFRRNRLDIKSYEEVLRILLLNYEVPFDFSFITDSVRNPDMLWDIAQTFPQSLGVTGITDNFQMFRKLNHVKNLLSSKIQNPEIVNALNQSQYFSGRFNYRLEECFKFNGILQVLTDEKIISRCDTKKIIDFMNNPSVEGLSEIVGEAYGDRAKEIFDSRPGLTLENIPNLKIFDEAIFENFGESVIHNTLTYDSKYAFLLADLVRHPDRMAEYKKFERLTEGFFVENVSGNEAKFKAYAELMPLIKQIDEKDMTPERMEALRAVITDLDKEECRIIPLQGIGDLDRYIENRNRMYDTALAKSSELDDIRDLLSRRFFGMPYESDYDDRYQASRLSLNGMMRYHNIDTFLEDSRTQESDLFTDDERDMIKLASIISKVKDPKVLEELYHTLSSRDDVLTPAQFQQIKQKIPLQYSRELVSQLLTPEKAREMVQNGEQGIDIELDEDGIETINLRGADFKIMLHTLMGIDGGANNSGIHIPRGELPEEIWKKFERGCSTISSCVIEPNMLKSCGSDTSLINLGFCSIDPRLVIGMSHHDAHVSHNVGDPDPMFEYWSVKMNYPEELLRKTAAQIKGVEDKDSSHEYNEVAFFRREQDLDKITSENFGGKIMPDYIVVYGKPNSEHKRLAKAFARDGKPIPIICIDREQYRDGMYMRAYQKDEKHIAKPENDSELIETTKKVTHLGEGEER